MLAPFSSLCIHKPTIYWMQWLLQPIWPQEPNTPLTHIHTKLFVVPFFQWRKWTCFVGWKEKKLLFLSVQSITQIYAQVNHMFQCNLDYFGSAINGSWKYFAIFYTHKHFYQLQSTNKFVEWCYLAFIRTNFYHFVRLLQNIIIL